MEDYIKLSTLNDFIFCPKSIYYHNIYDNYNKKTYQQNPQITGTQAHESIDYGKYSSRKDVLQGVSVFCEKLGIAGKIDVFFAKDGRLVERKYIIHRDQETHVGKIYLGYKYQLWGQMFCLQEMGYKVKSLEIYSMSDNTTYRVCKPTEEQEYQFSQFLKKYRRFDLLKDNWKQNITKCRKCIYKELCDYYAGDIFEQMSLFR